MISGKHIQADLLASLLNERALLAVILVGQLLAITLSFSPLVKSDAWLVLPPVSLFIHFVSLSSLASLHALKNVLKRANYLQQLALFILLFCAFTLIASYITFSLELITSLSLTEFLLRNLLISFIIAVLYAQFSIIHAEHTASKQLATKAKLSSLQARIRPHFLYNSLNVAAELVYHDAQDAEKTILALAALSRAALYCDEDLSLEKELELAQQYILVESWRFGERLSVNWQLPQSLPDIVVPALTIQPLLENAICHGVEPNPNASHIEIQMQVTNQSVTLIIDNPYLANVDKVRRSNGIAVENIKARLAMRFGKRAQLSHYIQKQSYRTKLVIPRSG